MAQKEYLNEVGTQHLIDRLTEYRDALRDRDAFERPVPIALTPEAASAAPVPI